MMAAVIAIVSSPAFATPTTLATGESVIFNFDTNGYGAVQILTWTPTTDLDFAGGEAGLLEHFDGLNATGADFSNILSGFACNGNLTCFPGYATLLQGDGLFSIRVTSVSGSFTVDARAALYTANTSLLAVLEPTTTVSSVPEPGSLSLLATALLAVTALGRRAFRRGVST